MMKSVENRTMLAIMLAVSIVLSALGAPIGTPKAAQAAETVVGNVGEIGTADFPAFLMAGGKGNYTGELPDGRKVDIVNTAGQPVVTVAGTKYGTGETEKEGVSWCYSILVWPTKELAFFSAVGGTSAKGNLGVMDLHQNWNQVIWLHYDASTTSTKVTNREVSYVEVGTTINGNGVPNPNYRGCIFYSYQTFGMSFSSTHVVEKLLPTRKQLADIYGFDPLDDNSTPTPAATTSEPTSAPTQQPTQAPRSQETVAPAPTANNGSANADADANNNSAAAAAAADDDSSAAAAADNSQAASAEENSAASAAGDNGTANSAAANAIGNDSQAASASGGGDANNQEQDVKTSSGPAAAGQAEDSSIAAPVAVEGNNNNVNVTNNIYNVNVVASNAAVAAGDGAAVSYADNGSSASSSSAKDNGSAAAGSANNGSSASAGSAAADDGSSASAGSSAADNGSSSSAGASAADNGGSAAAAPAAANDGSNASSGANASSTGSGSGSTTVKIKTKNVISWSVKEPVGKVGFVKLAKTVNGHTGIVCEVKVNYKKHTARYNKKTYRNIKRVFFSKDSKMILIKYRKNTWDVVPRATGKVGKNYTVKHIKGVFNHQNRTPNGTINRIMKVHKGKTVRTKGVSNIKPKRLK